MDEELRSFLVGMETRLVFQVDEKIRASEARLEEKIGASEARLEEKIGASEARLEEKIGASEARLEEKIGASEARLEEKMAEKINDSETNLLREFWKWGRTSDQRMRRVEHSDATTADRLTNMEERIFTLERKVAGSKE